MAIAADGIELPGEAEVIRVPETIPELTPAVFAAALQRLNVSIGQALNMEKIEPSLIPKVTRVE